MGLNDDKPAEQAAKVDFWKIPIAKLPLGFLIKMERELTDPAELAHLRQHIATRRAAGERPRTAKEIADRSAAHLARKQADKDRKDRIRRGR